MFIPALVRAISDNHRDIAVACIYAASTIAAAVAPSLIEDRRRARKRAKKVKNDA